MPAPIDPLPANPAPRRAEVAHGHPPVVIPARELDGLVRVLLSRGYEVLGPVARDGAIMIERIEGAADLPRGFEDVQAPGRYRLEQKGHGAYFAFTVGPQSWKKVFHVPHERLFQVRRKKKDGLTFVPEPTPRGKHALIGARACEIAAISIQDRVLIEGDHPDPRYASRREETFVVAVNCARAGGTCFCTSMETGPRATRDYDLALTELIGEGEHRFLVEVGSDAGASVLAELGGAMEAPSGDLERSLQISKHTAESMGRTLETRGLKERLQQNLEDPRWDVVAERCLACANCTMVCPTCFCTEVIDTTDLSGETAERHKRLDSCFNLDFSHVHGGSVRQSVKGRYRQWLTHKLASWWDQFGTSGCVGCGRCITFCPVGIDITEEASSVGRAASPKE